YHLWLSPDEKRFIADRPDPQTSTYDLWLYDISGDNPQRFTDNPASEFNPVWEPNGSRIVWTSDRDVFPNLYQKSASLTGEEAPMWKSDYGKSATDWSRDGRFIIYRQLDPKTKWDLWVLPVNESDEVFPVARTEANEIAGTISPDGRWLAYASNDSGR